MDCHGNPRASLIRAIRSSLMAARIQPFSITAAPLVWPSLMPRMRILPPNSYCSTYGFLCRNKTSVPQGSVHQAPENVIMVLFALKVFSYQAVDTLQIH